MRPITAFAVAVAVLLTSCTTTPRRFTRDKTTPRGCGYHVESAGRDGFILEVFFHGYSFMPGTDDEIQAARKCFRISATSVAAKMGRKIQMPTSADMAASTSRNPVDAHNSVYISGRVWFARE